MEVTLTPEHNAELRQQAVEFVLTPHPFPRRAKVRILAGGYRGETATVTGWSWNPQEGDWSYSLLNFAGMPLALPGAHLEFVGID